MGVRVARVLLPAYFRASSRRRGRRRRNNLLGEEQNRWERWASGRVAKTSWRENKSDGDVELEWIWGLVSDGLGQRASLLWPQRGCNGHLNQPMNLVVATRSSTMVSPWGLGGMSSIAEEDGKETSRRVRVVALKKRGSNGPKNRPWWGEE
jgi:hypothetical protein